MYYNISHHIISYHIILYYIILYYIIVYHIISYHIILYYYYFILYLFIATCCQRWGGAGQNVVGWVGLAWGEVGRGGVEWRGDGVEWGWSFAGKPIRPPPILAGHATRPKRRASAHNTGSSCVSSPPASSPDSSTSIRPSHARPCDEARASSSDELLRPLLRPASSSASSSASSPASSPASSSASSPASSPASSSDELLVVTGVERRVSWIHLVGALKFHPGSPSDVLTFLVHCVRRLALRQQELVCTEKAVR